MSHGGWHSWNTYSWKDSSDFPLAKAEYEWRAEVRWEHDESYWLRAWKRSVTRWAVYFSRLGDAVKIGTSPQPFVRGGKFGQVIRVEWPDIDGRTHERELHLRFSHLRFRFGDDEGCTEWFRLEQDLADYLSTPSMAPAVA